jgi:PIN domain nuclease of toxin-antitoxin system
LIILDTHIVLWWAHDPQKLSSKARTAIQKEEKRNGIHVSSISIWEIALKNSQGNLFLPYGIHEWYDLFLSSYPGIVIDSLTPQVAIESTQLPGDFHKDPADRFITALARHHGVPLVTADQKILNYKHVQTIW